MFEGQPETVILKKTVQLSKEQEQNNAMVDTKPHRKPKMEKKKRTHQTPTVKSSVAEGSATPKGSPSCHSCHQPSDKLQMKKGRDCDHDGNHRRPLLLTTTSYK